MPGKKMPGKEKFETIFQSFSDCCKSTGQETRTQITEQLYLLKHLIYKKSIMIKHLVYKNAQCTLNK
jgi:hypothetical protein